jgi:hypothetical protein
MKVYVVIEYSSCTGSTDDFLLAAIFSKEEYAEQYCDKYNKDMERFYYVEVDVDDGLEGKE